jgi:hypothetical protein
MKQTLFITLLFFSCCLSAQTVINGNVKNTEGKPVIATVTVQSKGVLTISGFASTNDFGYYSVVYKGNADSIIITVSGINIGKHQKTVANRSAQVDFSINEKPLELKESTVTAQKIRQTGDTLNYNVASYTEQQDRVIGDVLKKMPGIEVENNGQITYQNIPINKFYVEDMDLLQGRYGIAVNNISVKDVAQVQIYEKHQPIKMLRDRVFSNQAAINLKLKDAAKGTVSINALAGAGYEPVLWQSELVAMYFAAKKQNMSAYKSNNTGQNIISEFRTHYDYERVYMSPDGILSVQMPSSPPIAQKRYLQNNTHAVTVNQLIKLKEEWQMNLNALYYTDYIKKNSYSRYEQYLPNDSTLDIEEQINSKSRIHNAEIALRLNANANDYYFNNALNLKGNWDSDKGFGNTYSKYNNLNESISQYLDKPFFSLDNTFTVMKNMNDNVYKLYFSFGYGHRPHSLTIKPANYFNRNDLESATQDALLRDFGSVLRLSYGLKIKKISADYAIWGSADIKNMNTELMYITTTNTHETADSLKNNMYYNTYQTGISQNYSYKTNTFRTSLNIPLVYNIFTVDDRIPNNFSRQSKITFNPSLSLSYDLTNNFTVSTSGRITKSFGGINSSYTGYIMKSYRSLQNNPVEKMFETKSENLSVSCGYRDAFKSLFINAAANYTHASRNLLYGYDYQGILTVQTAVDKPTESNVYNANFSIQKGLSFMQGSLRLAAGYRKSKSDLLLQNEVMNYCSQGYNASGNISFSPFSFASVSYSLMWNSNKSYVIGKSENFPSIRGISQNFQLSLHINKALTAQVNSEYIYNSAATERNTNFADAGLKFKTGKYDIEVELNNIFNSKHYVSATYSDISAYYYTYNLRPRSLLLKIRFKLL